MNRRRLAFYSTHFLSCHGVQISGAFMRALHAVCDLGYDAHMPQDIQWFEQRLFRWFGKNHRDLPWRKTRDPYKILVSEIMLQQTQVDRVIAKYQAFLKEFPTREALAKARTSAVIRAWSGLGYNRRALYLRGGAEVRVREPIPVIPGRLIVIPSLSRDLARSRLRSLS